MSHDVQQQLKSLQKEVDYYKAIAKEMTVPLIETLVDHTLLIPLTGHIFPARSETIRAQVFNYLKKHHSIKIIIFDFTAITPKNLQFIKSIELSSTLKTLNKTLQTIGIRPIYCGFHPEVVFSLVSSGFTEELESYSTYKKAIQKVAKDFKSTDTSTYDHG